MLCRSSHSEGMWDLYHLPNGLWKACYQPAFWDFPVKEGLGVSPNAARANARYTPEYYERCRLLREVRVGHARYAEAKSRV